MRTKHFTEKSVYILWIIFSCALLIFSAQFVLREHYIFFWDYSSYHEKFEYIGNIVTVHGRNFFKILSYYMQEDYNLLPVLPLLPLRLALGSSRVAYICSIVIMYILPFLFVFTRFFKKICSHKTQSHFLTTSSVLLAFLFSPSILLSVFLGYLDSFGMIFITMIYVSYLTEDETLTFKKSIYLGLLLASLFLFRRWYGYWVASFVFCLSCYEFIKLIKDRKFIWSNVIFLVTNIVVLAVTMEYFLFIVAPTFAVRALKTNYFDEYSAFKFTPLSSFWKVMQTHSGNLTIVLIAVGIGICLWSKQLRKAGLFIIIHLIAVLLLFTRIQDLDSQHYYQFYPAFLMFIAVTIIYYVKFANTTRTRVVYLGIISILALINFIVVFVPAMKFTDMYGKYIFATTRYYPPQRSDFNELQKLMDFVQSLYKKTPGDFYVLSYATVMNDELFKNMCSLYVRDTHLCTTAIQNTSAIDKRDTFPDAFFRSRYIVMVNPVQHDLRPRDQHVLMALTSDFVSNGEISKSFSKLPVEYNLDGNIRVNIYEKNKAIPKEEIQKLSQRLLEIYPNYEYLYKYKDIDQSLSYTHEL